MKIVGFLWLMFFCSGAFSLDSLSNEPWVEINGERIFVEVANNNESQSRGLMYREALDKNKGMLFVFPVERVLKFWMKNTFIPLDIIYLDKELRVVNVTAGAQPCAQESCTIYSSIIPARYALEVNAGCSSYLKLKVGDVVRFGGGLLSAE